MKGAPPPPIFLSLSFFWGKKGLIIPESQYGSPLYNHCFQQHCQQGVNGERERVGETGRECVCVCVSPVVVFNTSYGEALFQFEVHDTLVEYVFVGSFFFPSFLPF